MDYIEIVEMAEEGKGTIKLAIQELEDNKMFDKIVKDLEATISELEGIIEEYAEEASRQNDNEKEYMNSMYERMVR